MVTLKFRKDMLGHYINDVSTKTFKDAEDRLNYLEEKDKLPDMREKVKEYLSELDAEIDRCTQYIEDKQTKLKDSNIDISKTKEGKIFIDYKKDIEHIKIEERLKTLIDTKNDLEGRMSELA